MSKRRHDWSIPPKLDSPDGDDESATASRQTNAKPSAAIRDDIRLSAGLDIRRMHAVIIRTYTHVMSALRTCRRLDAYVIQDGARRRMVGGGTMVRGVRRIAIRALVARAAGQHVPCQPFT